MKAIRLVVLLIGLFSMAFGQKVMVGGFDVGPGGSPGLFNPLTNTAGFTWLNKYFSTLVLYDVNFQFLQGDLAKGWSVSPDGLKYTFKLREGVTWHDGQPFTSKDVKFTLESIRNPDVASFFSAKLEMIKNVDTPNATTAVVNLTRPNAALLDALTQVMMLPEHALSSIAPKDLRTTNWWVTNPIGTGPFKWSKYVADQYVELVAFDNYWRGRPKLDKLVNRYFKEAGSSILALRSGDIQFTYASLDEAKGLKNISNLRIIEGPSQVLNYIGFNNKEPRFKDLKVRQAFLYAIDRNTIAQQLFAGGAQVVPCIYNNAKFIAGSGLTDYSYSPDKAKQLLAEAGWDKIKGEPIEFLYYYQDQLSSDVIVAIQQMLAQVGIEVKPRKVDVPTYNQITGTENFALVYAGAGNGPDPDALIVNFDSNSVPPKGNNRMRINNPEVDKLFIQGQTTSTAGARAKVYQNICSISNQTLPWAPMWVAKRFGVVGRNVSGFVWTPAPGGGRYYDAAEKWDISGKENPFGVAVGQYILRRLLVSIPVLLIITVAIFSLLQMVPGDPLDAYIPPDQAVSEAQRNEIRHQLGLDKPPVVQYVYWLSNALRGNLGYRIKNQQPVWDEIRQRIGPTLSLMSAGMGLGIVLGILFGVIAAVRRYSILDQSLTVGAFLGISTPPFLAGLLGLYFFALKLKIFPSGGYATPGQPVTTGDVLSHLALPALILSLFYIAIIMRYTRSSVLEVLGLDYVRTARAKGLAEIVTTRKHVLRNALIPIVTVVGANFANLVGGAVFLESIYSWPGMGQLYLDGVESRDYPLIMGLTLVLASVILLANLITDLLYGLIDPRIRYD